MTKVIHGGDIHQYAKDIIDFSSNINPLGIPQSVEKVLRQDFTHLQQYPDLHYTALRQAIARDFSELDAANVIVGNGAAEIIYLAGQLCHDRKILISVPAFGEYAEAVELGGGEVDYAYRRRENNFALPTEEILKRLPEVDGIFLGHPNNPTGDLIRQEELLQIVERTRVLNKFLIIDEAFIDFVPDPAGVSAVQWLAGHHGMLVIRAFTKFYAMPGLRLGYGLGTEALIARLKSRQIPWSVNSFAVKVGLSLLADTEYRERSRQWILQEREFLICALAEFPQLKIYPTETNYILCEIKDRNLNAAHLKTEMLYRGILIRDASTFEGLDAAFFRVAIKGREDNVRLIEILRAVLRHER